MRKPKWLHKLARKYLNMNSLAIYRADREDLLRKVQAQAMLNAKKEVEREGDFSDWGNITSPNLYP
jgi:hypothetical protein